MTIGGSFGVQKNGSTVIFVSQNASATISNTSASGGIQSGQVALILNGGTNNRLLYASGSFSLTAGTAFGAISGSLMVAQNNTGFNSITQTVTVGAISVNVPVLASGIQVISGTALSVQVSNFVTISGDLSVKKDAAGSLYIIGSNISASISSGSSVVGVTGAGLGMVLPDGGGVVLQTTGGTVVATLPSSLGSIATTAVEVEYNSTGAAFSSTVTVGAVSAVVDVGSGSVVSPFASVLIKGLDATISGFARLGGDFGFKPAANGGLQVVATNASALVSTTGGAMSAGVTAATVGMLINSDGSLVVSATGTAQLTLPGNFLNVNPGTMGVTYNTTGPPVSQTLTHGSVNVVLDVPAGTAVAPYAVVNVTGFSATVSNFVSIQGNLAIQKTSVGDLSLIGSNLLLSLEAGPANIRSSGSSFGALIKNGGGFAIRATGTPSLTLGDFASAQATSAEVIYNSTGAAVSQSLSFGGLTVDLTVASGTQVSPLMVMGLAQAVFSVSGFVEISGNFGFRMNGSDIIGGASSANVTLSTVGVVTAGVTGAKLAFVVKPNGKTAFQTSQGSVNLQLGSSLTVTAGSVGINYNKTGVNVVESFTAQVGATTVAFDLDVDNNAMSFTATGVSVNVAEFVTLSGDFGFARDGSSLLVVGEDVTAALGMDGVNRLSVSGATLGMVVTSAGGVAFQTSGGSLTLNLGAFASVDAGSLAARFNNTGANVSRSLTVVAGDTSITAPVNVADGTVSMVATDLQATIAESVTIRGHVGFKKNAAGRIIAAGNSVSVTLDAGVFVQAGLTSTTVGMILTPDNKVALQATGGNVQLSLASGFATATATAFDIRFNNTGSDVDTTITGTAAGISAPISVASGVTSVVASGFQAQISEFVSLSGTLGFKKDSTNRILVAGNNVTASLSVGSIVEASVTGATFGMVITEDALMAFQTNGGSASLVLGSGFASATATNVAVRYNDSGADINVNITNAIIGVTATVNVADGTTSVVLTGFEAEVAGFVRVSGNIGMKKDASGRIIAAGTGMNVRLETGGVVTAGVTGATFGLVINGDEQVAFQTTNGAVSLSLGSGFASATASAVSVTFNNSNADIDTTITGTAAGIIAQVRVLKDVISLQLTDLSATIADFVKLTGTYGIKKDASGDFHIVANDASALLEIGAVVKAGVTGATLGLVLKADGKLAMQTSGGAASFVLGGGFASATATSVSARYNNTGALVNQTLSVNIGSNTVSAPLSVANGVTSVVVSGLNAKVDQFVTISGDLGFKLDSSGRLIAAGNSVSALLSVGNVVKAGVSGATFGLIVTGDEKVAFQTTGGIAALDLGNGFASVTATSVNVNFNNTNAAVNVTITGASAGISADIDVAAGVSSVVVLGLSAQMAQFVSITGDVGISLDSAGNLTVVGNSVSATLDAGSAVRVGVTGADFGLLVKENQTVALQTNNGSMSLVLGSGFASATATNVSVRFNNTGALVDQTLEVSVGGASVSVPMSVADGVTSVVVTGLVAQVSDFVTVRGNLGFKRDATGRVIAAGNQVDVQLEAGSAVKLGITNATFGLIITSTERVALQVTGGDSIISLGSGFASATATVAVSYNNTGSNVNTTITGSSAGISAPVNVANGVTSLQLTGLNAQIAEFVTLTGDFGAKKEVDGSLVLVGTGVSAMLLAGSVVRVGVSGATIGVLITSDQKIGVQSTGGSFTLDVGSGFASASATSVSVRYNNTGTALNRNPPPPECEDR